MITLVVGATGATGRLLVEQLVLREQRVRAIVRSPDRLPAALRDEERVTVIAGSLLHLGDAELLEHVRGCGAVASCLGHTLTFRGVFGPLCWLVAEATRRLCAAVKASGARTATKLVLMNTAGNRNRDLQEPRSFAERCVIGAIRALVPPQADNEQAADYLRTEIGQRDAAITWAVVRPDTLIDEAQVTDYDVHRSPTRSAVFNAGKTSRVNVAHFMAELITNDDTWRAWQGQMPVLYNRS